MGKQCHRSLENRPVIIESERASDFSSCTLHHLFFQLLGFKPRTCGYIKAAASLGSFLAFPSVNQRTSWSTI